MRNRTKFYLNKKNCTVSMNWTTALLYWTSYHSPVTSACSNTKAPKNSPSFQKKKLCWGSSELPPDPYNVFGSLSAGLDCVPPPASCTPPIGLSFSSCLHVTKPLQSPYYRHIRDLQQSTALCHSLFAHCVAFSFTLCASVAYASKWILHLL